MVDPFAAAPHLLPFAQHGGNLALAAATFPDAPRPWLDLSTGINPRPYPLPEIPAAAWARLPDAEALRALEIAAAGAYRARPAEGIVAAPGTQAIIQRLPILVPRARIVMVLGPTYAEHAAVWRATGAAVETTDDVESLARADVAVVVNPNNPDGRLVDVEVLRRLAVRLDRRDGLLVVDEAFVDLLNPASSLVPGGVPKGAVVLRSFGKVYGLAGIRLGFLIGAPAMARQLSTALGPWAVPGPTIVVGRAALADEGWIDAARQRLRRDGKALDAVLAQAGFTPLGGTPLFRLVRHPQARQRFNDLAEAGILVRAFHDEMQLRVGATDGEKALRRLAAALRVGVAGSVSAHQNVQTLP